MQSTGHTSTHDWSTQSRQSRVITQAIASLSQPARSTADAAPRLAELLLLVDDVLAYDGVVLLELELVRCVLLVLHRGVVVPRPGRGLELDALALALLGHLMLPPGPLDLGRRRHRLAALREDADAAAPLLAHAHAARLAGAGIDEHDVGGVDHALLLDDAAGARRHAPGLHVALMHPHLLDPHPAPAGVHRGDPPLL